MLLALERLPRGAAREELHEVSPKNTTNKSHTNQLVATVAASGAAETNERQQKYKKYRRL